MTQHRTIPNSTPFVDSLGITDPTPIDTIAAAILQNGTANFPADGVVLHPTDWMKARTLKDADGRYRATGYSQSEREARSYVRAALRQIAKLAEAGA